MKLKFKQKMKNKLILLISSYIMKIILLIKILFLEWVKIILEFIIRIILNIKYFYIKELFKQMFKVKLYLKKFILELKKLKELI